MNRQSCEHLSQDPSKRASTRFHDCGAAALALALSVLNLSCAPNEEIYCDLKNQLTFLGVGPAIVGDWYKEGDEDTADPYLRFNEKGHLDHFRFGCGNALLPITPEGTNSTRTDWSYQYTTLARYVIEPGHYRLEYDTQRSLDWIDARLLPDGRLQIESNYTFYLSGTFVKRSSPSTSN